RGSAGLLRFFQAYVISGMGLWFLHVHFLFPVCSVVCGLAVYVSGKFIVATSALVDGFREEPETGKVRLSLSPRYAYHGRRLRWSGCRAV
ncbi:MULTISPECIES: hypothetical protein, partial [unclassified Sporosarcina]|uniref:hypothetical protein n=1 Tax=unclassified Sporosarcina TaxID=2647733 RepID=UPI001E633ED6